jgi:hypothetical protein
MNGLKIPSGIVIPWKDEDGVRALSVRQLDATPKYKVVAKSCRQGVFPYIDIEPGQPIVICEGEFDCLLLNQTLCGVAIAITLGSASARPTYATLIRLAAASTISLVYDNDDAGERASEYWTQLSPHVQKLSVPAGQDITDIWAAGVDLKEWVLKQIEGTSCSVGRSAKK